MAPVNDGAPGAADPPVCLEIEAALAPNTAERTAPGSLRTERSDRAQLACLASEAEPTQNADITDGSPSL